jgi:steroid delta-isomerase-like uncharacterized protein
MRDRVVIGIVAFGLCSLLASCSGQPSMEQTEKQNMAVVRETHAALLRGDLEAFKASLTPNYVRHCQAMPPHLQELRGTEEFLSFIEEFITAVELHEDTISQMFAQGDMVAYVSTMTGTQTGPMGDLPASGKSFTVVNIIIQRLEGGKIAETWVSWDNVAMLSQLGFFPPAAPAPEAG